MHHSASARSIEQARALLKEVASWKTARMGIESVDSGASTWNFHPESSSIADRTKMRYYSDDLKELACTSGLPLEFHSLIRSCDTNKDTTLVFWDWQVLTPIKFDLNVWLLTRTHLWNLRRRTSNALERRLTRSRDNSPHQL